MRLTGTLGNYFATVLGALVLLNWSARAAAEPSELMAAAHQQHLWFAVKAAPPGKGFMLCHSALDMGGPFYRPQSTLTEMPAAMAAWRNRVWLVFESSEANASPRREIYTLAVIPDEMLGRYVSEPRDRLEIVAPLPQEGSLLSFAATPRGPIALLSPTSGQTQPRLLQLQSQSGGWIELDLPAEFAGSNDARLAVYGPQNELFSILSRVPEDANKTLRFDHLDHGAEPWKSVAIDLKLSDVESISSVAGQMVTAAVDRSRPSLAELNIQMVRPAGAIPILTLPRPEGHWALAGMGDGLRLLQRDPQGLLSVRTIDPLRPTAAEPAIMSVQPVSSARLWQMAVLITVTVAGLLLLFLVRPAKKEMVKLPPGTALLPTGQRVMAVVFDLIPGGMAAMFILRAPIGDLLAMPVLSTDFEQCMPYLLMAAVALAHSTIGELIASKSLGKAILGARLIKLDGSRPSGAQILLRSAVKGLVLFVPPLAIVALLNPHTQGIADMAAGTLVVHEVEPEQTQEP